MNGYWLSPSPLEWLSPPPPPPRKLWEGVNHASIFSSSLGVNNSCGPGHLSPPAVVESFPRNIPGGGIFIDKNENVLEYCLRKWPLSKLSKLLRIEKHPTQCKGRLKRYLKEFDASEKGQKSSLHTDTLLEEAKASSKLLCRPQV